MLVMALPRMLRHVMLSGIRPRVRISSRTPAEERTRIAEGA